MGGDDFLKLINNKKYVRQVPQLARVGFWLLDPKPDIGPKPETENPRPEATAIQINSMMLEREQVAFREYPSAPACQGREGLVYRAGETLPR